MSDRRPARVTLPDQPTATIVPTIRNNRQEVELAIYDKDTTLARRLLLSENRQVAANVAFLPSVTFGVGADSFTLVEPPSKESVDCCVNCCYGGVYICAEAVCCRSGDPSCGSCCDGGHCPAPGC